MAMTIAFMLIAWLSPRLNGDYAYHFLANAETTYGGGWSSDYLAPAPLGVSYFQSNYFHDDYIFPGAYREMAAYARSSLITKSILGIHTISTKNFGTSNGNSFPAVATATAYWQDAFVGPSNGQPLTFQFRLSGKVAASSLAHGFADSRLAIGIDSSYLATPQPDVGSYNLNHNAAFIVNNQGWGATNYFDEFIFDGLNFTASKSVVIPFDNSISGYRIAAYIASRSTSASGTTFFDSNSSLGLSKILDSFGNEIPESDWEFESGMSSVPEPSSWLFTIVGLIAFLRRKMFVRWLPYRVNPKS